MPKGRYATELESHLNVSYDIYLYFNDSPELTPERRINVEEYLKERPDIVAHEKKFRGALDKNWEEAVKKYNL